MPRINAVSYHEEHSIEAICRRVLAAGFDSLELSRPLFYEKLSTPGLRRHFAAWAASQDLELFGFDCWVEVDPYHRRHEVLAEFARALDWASDLNLGLVITHDPWAAVNADRTASQVLTATIELFRPVVEIAVERQLRLVFEPHPDTHSMDNHWAIEFVDSLGEEAPPGAVGLLYDCCHYGVGQPQGYLAAIRRLGPRIQHLHFSDGDLRTYALHLPLGDGAIDLSAVVAALADVGFSGTVTNDLYNYPLLDDGARRNALRMRELEATLKLSAAKNESRARIAP